MHADAPQLRTIRSGRAIQFGLDWDCSEFAVDLPVDDLPLSLDGLRILHLSDTHFHATWRASYDRALERIAAGPLPAVAVTHAGTIRAALAIHGRPVPPERALPHARALSFDAVDAFGEPR